MRLSVICYYDCWDNLWCESSQVCYYGEKCCHGTLFFHLSSDFVWKDYSVRLYKCVVLVIVMLPWISLYLSWWWLCLRELRSEIPQVCYYSERNGVMGVQNSTMSYSMCFSNFGIAMKLFTYFLDIKSVHILFNYISFYWSV